MLNLTQTPSQFWTKLQPEFGLPTVKQEHQSPCNNICLPSQIMTKALLIALHPLNLA